MCKNKLKITRINLIISLLCFSCLVVSPTSAIASDDQNQNHEESMQEVRELPENKLRDPVSKIMSGSITLLKSSIEDLKEEVQDLKAESDINKNKIEILTTQVVSITEALKDNPALKNMQKFGGK